MSKDCEHNVQAMRVMSPYIIADMVCEDCEECISTDLLDPDKFLKQKEKEVWDKVKATQDITTSTPDIMREWQRNVERKTLEMVRDELMAEQGIPSPFYTDPFRFAIDGTVDNINKKIQELNK